MRPFASRFAAELVDALEEVEVWVGLLELPEVLPGEDRVYGAT